MKLLHKLLLLSVLPFIIIITAIIIVNANLSESILRKQIAVNAGAGLNFHTNSIDSFFRNKVDEIKLMAATPVVRGGDIREILHYLDREQSRLSGSVEGLYYNDVDGTAYDTSGATFSVRDRYYFPQIVRGEIVITRAITSRSTQRPVVLILAPVFDVNGYRTGAVGGTILLENLLQMIMDIKVGENGFALLLDEDNRIISDILKSTHNNKDSFSQPRGISDSDEGLGHLIKDMHASSYGTTRLVHEKSSYHAFFKSMKIMKWSLALVYREDEIFADVRQMRNINILIFSFAIISICVFIFMLKRILLNPIHDLVRAQQQLGKGDLYVRADAGSGDEIGKLAQSFNVMAEQLNERTTVIEKEINVRKRAEELLREREERLKAIIETEPECVKILASDGTIIEMNSSGLVMIEAESIDQVAGRSLYPFISPEYRDAFRELTEGVCSGTRKSKESLEFELIGLKGTRRWLDTHAAPLRNSQNQIIGLLGVTHDITERKKVEETLRQSESKYRSLVNNINLGITLIDRDHNIIMTNEAQGRMFNKSAGEFAGKKCFREFQKREKACAHCPGTHAMTTGLPQKTEAEGVRDDGIRLLVSIRAFPTFGPEGDVTGFIKVVEDITETQKAEKSLKQYERIVSASNDQMSYVDRDFVYRAVNDSYLKAFNASRDEIVGHYVAELQGREVFESTIRDNLDRCLKGEDIHYQAWFDFPGHGRRYMDVAYYPYFETNGTLSGIVVNSRDITERKKLEEQLIHAQKMESIGVLAGGIAHDFNNILTVITGFGGVIKMKMKEDDPLRQKIDYVLSAADKGAYLIHNLLAFSRKQIVNPISVNINEIVKKSNKFLLRIIGEDIEFRTILSDDDLTVMVDSTHMEQVLMNLATNARDAMPKGGLMTISTESFRIDDEFIRSHGYGGPGEFALISLSDTGEGMDEHTKERIFEPFFTTKDVGKGTGLGLSIIYGIVKQHNGYIDVASEPGEGTTFRIYLPMIKKEVEDTGRQQAKTIAPTGGTETILVAEDDKMIREFITSVLMEFGYKIIAAENGEDAVKKFMDNKDQIQFLILDAIMPNKSGMDVYNEIIKTRPDIKGFFLSGYSEKIIEQRNVLSKELEIVSKPIIPDDLLKKIREKLDKDL